MFMNVFLQSHLPALTFSTKSHLEECHTAGASFCCKHLVVSVLLPHPVDTVCRTAETQDQPWRGLQTWMPMKSVPLAHACTGLTLHTLALPSLPPPLWPSVLPAFSAPEPWREPHTLMECAYLFL